MLQLTAIGRLTRDPEFKSNRQGSQFLVFDLAVNKGYGNNQTTVFVSCCASEGVKNALSKAKKGFHVVVTGELSTEIYQKNDGSTGENIKCFVTSFSFISSGSGQRNNQQNGNYAPQQNNNQYVQQPPMNNGQQYAQQPPMNNGQTYHQPQQPPQIRVTLLQISMPTRTITAIIILPAIRNRMSRERIFLSDGYSQHEQRPAPHITGQVCFLF